VAVLDSLRFGLPVDDKVRHILRGVVKGIGDYGNSYGVPTVGGEVYFAECYRDNPIVNAMAVGVIKIGQIARSQASGVGNPVLIVGSSTGRDGIHGATFASEEISDESETMRSAIQVGDPFTEKLLLEATLEAIRSESLVGLQDMGAAGIACSTSETSAKGHVGMVIDLDRVPKRERGMTAYELMLSESQERMLLVVKLGQEETVRRIYAKWDIHLEEIGRVTSGTALIAYHNGKKEVDVPAESLVLGGGAPVYSRESREPAYLSRLRSVDLNALPKPNDLGACLLQLLASPNIASKKWIYQQYDSMVRTNTIIQDGGDAAVVRLKDTQKALALTTDCNARYVYLNPRRGAQIAVAEAARNVACVGAKPIAITNCLNFGNPYDPEVFWQFKEAVAGIGDACRVFDTPVTGGNVSFYNEGPNGAIYPTPVIGMLGLIDDTAHALTIGFKNEGDAILLLGRLRGDVGGSEYLRVCHGLVAGDVPYLDLELESRLHALCVRLAELGLINSAHDVSEGGVATCIADCCLLSHGHLGARIKLNYKTRTDFQLFAEDQSVVVVSARANNVQGIEAVSSEFALPSLILGSVEPSQLDFDGFIRLPVETLAEEWEGALERAIERGTADASLHKLS
jgi:phosphoribosylformylglycinamidine synthase